jgi:predicted nucleic acid-binding protein
VIVDASVVTSALMAQTRQGGWSRDQLARHGLAAPHLLPAEVCQAIRRHAVAGPRSAASAADALGRLVELNVELHPFEPFAARVWELRDTVSAHDAWYVALAEALDVPFATLDSRLARAPGPRCTFVLPD